MKTFTEQLQYSCGSTYPLEDMLSNLTTEEILEEVNLFAKEVARESLNNASENYILICKYEEKSNYTKHGQSFIFNEHHGMKDYMKREIKVLKSTILSESNIPKL